MRERRVAAGRAAGVARDDDAQASRRALCLQLAQDAAIHQRVAGLGRVGTGRRAAHDRGGVGRAVVVPALADRHGLLAVRDLRGLPERRLALSYAARDEVAVTVAARGGDQAEGCGDVVRRARGDAGRVAGGPTSTSSP